MVYLIEFMYQNKTYTKIGKSTVPASRVRFIARDLEKIYSCKILGGVILLVTNPFCLEGRLLKEGGFRDRDTFKKVSTEILAETLTTVLSIVPEIPRYKIGPGLTFKGLDASKCVEYCREQPTPPKKPTCPQKIVEQFESIFALDDKDYVNISNVARAMKYTSPTKAVLQFLAAWEDIDRCKVGGDYFVPQGGVYLFVMRSNVKDNPYTNLMCEFPSAVRQVDYFINLKIKLLDEKQHLKNIIDLKEELPLAEYLQLAADAKQNITNLGIQIERYRATFGFEVL
jgi:hypothetical protein